MEAIGRLKEVNVIIRKESSVKAPWCCIDNACTYSISPFLYPLVETRKQLEDIIEIIFKQIIEINLQPNHLSLLI